MYHCFWTDPRTLTRHYEVYDEREPVIHLVEENALTGSDRLTVMDLVVIEGERLVFDAADVTR